MTQAICFKCGNNKHGAFKACQGCHERPLTEEDLVTSLCLTDHYFSTNTLIDIGRKIKSGEKIQFEERLTKMISSEIRTLIESPMGRALIGEPFIEKTKKWWEFWS